MKNLYNVDNENNEDNNINCNFQSGQTNIDQLNKINMIIIQLNNLSIIPTNDIVIAINNKTVSSQLFSKTLNQLLMFKNLTNSVNTMLPQNNNNLTITRNASKSLSIQSIPVKMNPCNLKPPII